MQEDPVVSDQQRTEVLVDIIAAVRVLAAAPNADPLGEAVVLLDAATVKLSGSTTSVAPELG